MPLITAAMMDTDRIIPQTGSSPGSNQSSTAAPHPHHQTPQQAYNGPAAGQPFNGVGGHYSGGATNPVRVKKKGDRTVAPPPPPTGHLINNSYANTTSPLQQHMMQQQAMSPPNGQYQQQHHQYAAYTPDLNGGTIRSSGITNHAYARDNLG